MRLIIIDDVSVEDIANILGTRHECARVHVENEPKLDWGSLLGKTIQIDDPNRGYIKGQVIRMDFVEELVTLEDYITPFEFKYISGIIS